MVFVIIPVCLNGICSWDLFICSWKKVILLGSGDTKDSSACTHYLQNDGSALPLYISFCCQTIKLPLSSDWFLDSKYEKLLWKDITDSHMSKGLFWKSWVGNALEVNEIQRPMQIRKNIMIFGDFHLSIQEIWMQRSSMKHRKWTVVYWATQYRSMCLISVAWHFYYLIHQPN